MWLENICEMKRRSGLTTNEISIKSGIPEPTLEKLFAGATKDPKLSTLHQLVHFFGYSLDDLDQPLDRKKGSLNTEMPVSRDQRERTILDLVGQLEDGQKDFLIALLEKVVSRTQSKQSAVPR